MPIALITVLILSSICLAEFDARQETVKLMEKAGWGHLLSAPVYVRCVENGPVAITDDGRPLVSFWSGQ